MPKTIPELYDIFASNILHESLVTALADELGVNPLNLLKIGLGIHPTGGTRAYIIPERDNTGNIIGLMRRCEGGKKLMVKGGNRGLIYAVDPDFSNNGERYVPGSQNWKRIADANVQCPICGKSDWCLVSAEAPTAPAAVICSRICEGSVSSIEGCGHLHILKIQGRVNSVFRVLPETSDPIIVAEGHSDTVAAMDMGFVAVGRPSAEGGLGFLPDLVRGKEVIIVGDNDAGAGKKGAEATFRVLQPVCSKVTKLFPPSRFKDLRQWRVQTSLTRASFLEWSRQQGDTSGDPNVLESDVAHTIAKTWVKQEKTEDMLPTIRCYHGQWLNYSNGCYDEINREEFRGEIYNFLQGKLYSSDSNGKTGEGALKLSPYRPTRAKVSDIIDALSDGCTISQDPPVWLKNLDYPSPSNLIAFKNGILDINEYLEGRIKLYDPTPALFSFNILPYDFDEDAESKIWEDFHKEIFKDPDERKLLAQWMGYNCTADMSHEKLMLFVGLTRSGKGTILNTLASVLGKKQCVSTSFQTLCTEFGYQPLVGKLAVLLGDAKVPRRREAEAALEKILQVVGRDPVGVRRMYLPYLPQVYLKCRFTIAMNDLPNLPDHASALASRLNILYFGTSFAGKEDISLKHKLQRDAESGKIVNFALRGLKDLRESGRFTEPAKSLAVMKQLQELTTPVSAFVADCCELEPPGSEVDYHTVIDQLYEAWSVWSRSNNVRPGIKAQFGQWLTTCCPTTEIVRIKMDGRRHRVYRGIKLADWAYQEYLGVKK